jgi:prolyl oligopeptidase
MSTARLPRLRLVASVLVMACGGEAPTPITVPPLTTAVPVPTASAAPASDEDQAVKHGYPASRREDVVDTLHGVAVANPYRWLEDGSSEEVKAWSRAQDGYARERLAKLPERDAIAARLREVYYVESLGIPGHRGQRYFVTKKGAQDEKGIVYVRDGKAGKDRVLLNPNEWSKDGSASLGTTSASHDGRYMAYTVKTNNSDEATLYVMDVTSGKKLDIDVIPGAKYARASWTPRGEGFYYVSLPVDAKIPVAERPGYAELRFHKLGTDPKNDPVIVPKTGDATMFLEGHVSRDGKWLFHEKLHGWTSNEVYFREATKPNAAAANWVALAPGSKAHYEVEAYKDKFYVTTDEGAPRSRVFVVDPRKPERANWKEIVPEPKDEAIQSVGVRGGMLAITYLKNATGRLELRALDGSKPQTIELPGLGSVGALSGLPDDDEAWFSYTSYTEAWQSYALSIKSQKKTLYSATKVPFDASPYTTTQVFFPSKDGTRVSMFIVHRKDRKPSERSRVFLYGYGGFQVAETPSFNSTIVPWLERGGVYATVNLRGGSEYGESWHQDGMLTKKQNVFDDFIGAAEYLIREGYTIPSKLAIAGASNGGLLVGAAMTQRPDLFGAVLCGVPLLDMVRYHMFGSGKTWISEYGSSDDPSQFKALLAYSPYHHVARGTRYPALLMAGADSDDRVDPLHARKFIAEVQHKSVGGPAWLRVEKNSGHGGADLRKAEVEKNADRLAFALKFTE